MSPELEKVLELRAKLEDENVRFLLVNQEREEILQKIADLRQLFSDEVNRLTDSDLDEYLALRNFQNQLEGKRVVLNLDKT